MAEEAEQDTLRAAAGGAAGAASRVPPPTTRQPANATKVHRSETEPMEPTEDPVIGFFDGAARRLCTRRAAAPRADSISAGGARGRRASAGDCGRFANGS